MKTNLTFKDLGAGFNGISFRDTFEDRLSDGTEVLVTPFGIERIDMPRPRLSQISGEGSLTDVHIIKDEKMFVLGLIALVGVIILGMVALKNGK